MDQTRLDRSDAAYPTALNHYLGKDAPLSVAALGNLEILTHSKLAFFCPVKCPGALSEAVGSGFAFSTTFGRMPENRTDSFSGRLVKARRVNGPSSPEVA